MVSDLLDALGRQAGLAGRYAVSGVGGLGAAFANPLAVALNSVNKAVGSDYRFPDQYEALQRAMTEAGLPEPQGGLEKGIGFAAEMGVPDPTDSARVVAQLSHMIDPSMADNLIQAMTVFHGTPHKWADDTPDMSKIGTGEGAQAYGHGLYFAESDEVAQEYARTVGTDRKFYDITDIEDHVLANIDAFDGDLGIARNAMRSDVERSASGGAFAPMDRGQATSLLPDFDDTFDRIARDYDRANGTYRGKPLERTTGNLYELDLPDETIGKMLDWDAPLSEQPESVRKALQAHVDRKTSEKGGNLLLTDGATQNIAEMLKYPDEVKGWELYSTLSDDGFRAAGGLEQSQKQVSGLLNEAGIPGIKYLDGTSRSAGEGTRNFVVFDEQYITPLKRNGEELRQAMDAIK